MAFNRAELSLLEYANGFGIWHYRTTADSIGQASTSGYFTGIPTHLMRPGHLLLLDASDGRAWRAVEANNGAIAEVGALLGEAATPGAASVTHYGATGDGVTDDLAAFEAALAANDVVYVPQPESFYAISDTIVVPHGKGLIGTGKHFIQNAIRCTDKTKACVRLEGEVQFGNLSLGFTETITASDTGAIALALSSLRRSHILPVDVLNAGYGVRILQSQGALESEASNPAFANTWQHLSLRRCFVRAISLEAYETANTPQIFHFVRTTNFSTGTDRITADRCIELAVNTSVRFDVLNIEHGIYDSAIIRAGSGDHVSIGSMHLEGVSIAATTNHAMFIVGPDQSWLVGDLTIWDNGTNPTSIAANDIGYLVRLNSNSKFFCRRLKFEGIQRGSGADFRLVDYTPAAVSDAFVDIESYEPNSPTSITLTLNGDGTSGKMAGMLMRRLGHLTGHGAFHPRHGAGITTIDNASLAFERTQHGPHFRVAGNDLSAARALTAAQTPVAGDEITVWREAAGAFDFDVLGAVTLTSANMGCRVRYDGSAWQIISASAV